jgi:hypothetical protein
LTEHTRQALDNYLSSTYSITSSARRATSNASAKFLFTSRRRPGEPMTTRQYARLVAKWIAGIGLDPHIFATHSLRRTKATLIYRRTGNLRAVQLLHGRTASAAFDANDPSRKWSVHRNSRDDVDLRGARVGPVIEAAARPYQSTRLSRYDAFSRGQEQS